ncbi:polysaccharide deacetylase family protein [Paenibacillus sambharensis]|uniref:Polysaccharide deacetylase family protein n=1 Tax=Paenibacillus sambharensis TaxID=1803190 RepID=A0A2W1L0P7_9BACL|nr:polysaccharide deacetylase family protein [Paenibacillus sambharensis]PZD93498.1 polysaccharide deacetylase family protein [Paenibacillus sambharensis]
MLTKCYSAVTIIILAFTLAACGQNENTDVNPPGQPAETDTTLTDTPSKTPDNTVTQPEESAPEAAPDQVQEDNEDAIKEDPSAAGSKEAASSDGEETAAASPLYRMNEAYRFVPIEESTPAKVVLLTFDDGPKERDLLESMLDTLEKHNAKAVFFVNGYRAKANPELLKLIADSGHSIGNHSWDHIDLKKEKADVVRKQIGDVQELVNEVTGSKPKLFRPPFGSGGDSVQEVAKNEGLLYMTWSNGSLDWDPKNKNKPDAVITNVMDQLHPGANILMHELPWTAEALDQLLTKLEGKGYGFIDPETIQTGDKNEE